AVPSDRIGADNLDIALFENFADVALGSGLHTPHYSPATDRRIRYPLPCSSGCCVGASRLPASGAASNGPSIRCKPLMSALVSWSRSSNAAIWVSLDVIWDLRKTFSLSICVR